MAISMITVHTSLSTEWLLLTNVYELYQGGRYHRHHHRHSSFILNQATRPIKYNKQM